MVLDGGGNFSPAGIVGVHTLSLLLSFQPEQGRATGNAIYRTNVDGLTRGYSSPRQRGINSVPL